MSNSQISNYPARFFLWHSFSKFTWLQIANFNFFFLNLRHFSIHMYRFLYEIADFRGGYMGFPIFSNSNTYSKFGNSNSKVRNSKIGTSKFPSKSEFRILNPTIRIPISEFHIRIFNLLLSNLWFVVRKKRDGHHSPSKSFDVSDAEYWYRYRFTPRVHSEFTNWIAKIRYHSGDNEVIDAIRME